MRHSGVTMRMRVAIVLFPVVLSAIHGQVIIQQAHSIQLPAPPAPMRAWNLDKFSGGAVIRWRAETSVSDLADNLHVYDRDGKTIFSRRIWFPDAISVQIRDVSFVSERIGIVGVAFNNAGAPSGYWATIPIRGGVATVVQTGAFEGNHIVFGPDNTAWVLGWELGPDRKFETANPHSALRQFSLEGPVIHEHLPWPSTRCGRHPAEQTGRGDSFLVASDDRIGVFLSACQEWIEFARGDIVERRSVPNPFSGSADAKAHPPTIMGLALTSKNEVYISSNRGQAFRLNREGNVWEPWEPADTSASGVDVGRIAGSEGNSLVRFRGFEVSWLPVR